MIFVGFFDALKAKKGAEENKGPGPKKKETVEQPAGKYNEPCALCGNAGTEKKWMGQYWHKKCFRAARKGARKMV